MVTANISILRLILLKVALTMFAEARRDSTLWSAANFLSRYGYMTMTLQDTKDLTDSSLKDILVEPLMNMKRQYNLQPDGELDDATMGAMRQPRCGNSDLSSSQERHKRFTRLGDAKWGGFNGPFPVIIGFNNYTPKISKAEQEQQLLYCARKWAEVSGLSFRFAKVNEKPWIGVEFVKMDGPFNTVGFSLSPTPYLSPPDSYLHLDNEEPWVSSKKTGSGSFVSLQAAICHEMGHTVGLGHSADQLAVMFPSIGNQPAEAELSSDDIKGVQSIYGGPNGLTVVGLPSDPPKSTSKPPNFTNRPTVKPALTTTRRRLCRSCG